MALPNANIDIEDFSLGITSGGGAFRETLIGVGSAAIPDKVVSVANTAKAIELLGNGTLTDRVVQAIEISGKPVLAIGANPSVAGSASAVTQEKGVGAGTVAVSFAPDRPIQLKITTAGVLGTAAYTLAVDGGAPTGPFVTTAAPDPNIKLVAGTLCKLSIPGGTYIINETYDVGTDGVIVKSAGGPVITQASSPVDRYDAKVEIIVGGALGTATFKLSLDGGADEGNTFGPETSVPVGGLLAIAKTGLVLTFAVTFVAGDIYGFTTVPAGYSNADANSALDAWIADPRTSRLVGLVGQPATAAASASLATAVGSKMLAAENAFKYARASVECPHDIDKGGTEDDAAVLTAFAAFADVRVSVGVGDMSLFSPLTGRTDRRNVQWGAMARAGAFKLSEDVGKVEKGPIKGVGKLFRDESASPGLHDQGFMVMMTHQGEIGFFVARGLIRAPAGSDFGLLARGMVMDRACEITRAETLKLVNKEFNVDRATGLLLEEDALRIERRITNKLESELVGNPRKPNEASGTRVVVDRTENVLSTEKIPIDVRIIPKAYAKEINTTIGFLNPAIA